MQYNTGDTIHLKCRIAKGSYLVLWNKLGLDYPLTIGKNRFIPDERFQIQHKPPNRWNLIISNAQLNDTGVYSCTPGVGISTSQTDISKKSDFKEYQEYHSKSRENSQQTHMKATDDTTRRKNNGREYYVSVVEPLPSERYQVDAPANKIRIRNKTITLTGPNLVFYGTPLELICRASFPSYEAKLDPTISLEWYHRGIRRLSNPLKSGGVYITMHWLDSHLLESRLFIAWASEADAGQWICLERSNPVKNVNYTKLSSSYQNRHMNEYNTQSSSSSPTSYHYNTSVTYNPSKVDFVYDKIFIEIIDLPDTENSVQMTTIQNTISTVPTISSSSSSSTNSLLLSSSSSSSTPSMFNRKHSKSNAYSVIQHLNSKHKKLSFIERLFRSTNSCRKLHINQYTIIFFNLLYYLLLYMIIYTSTLVTRSVVM
ncbi:immunoglobulin V-set domain-containing-like protein isoform 1 [Schistosoma japonicum]|uniref:Immunoglobulin V-set domain-containing-like protein isoform 1 n=1 Tax=Schistosoma japonicum TaxID=6182 RepID=A0A4Z2DE84_SCHJA|nr:immunoglobulin V-set domain-containing-like protein isoform 1 [Schistosoma japonicum]